MASRRIGWRLAGVALLMLGGGIYGAPAAGDVQTGLCIVSLNLAKQEDVEKVQEELKGGPCEKVDIFLFQEVANEKDKPSVAEALADRIGYTAIFSPAAPGVYDQGLAVVSRFPFKTSEIIRLKSYNLKFHSRQRFALSATVRTPGGDLRVWNVHLDTRINPDERLEQLNPVLRSAVHTTGPALIGGDLNTNGFRWLGNVVPYPGGSAQGDAVRKVMRKSGFETPFTEDVITFPFLRQHLDWFFVRDLKPTASGTFEARNSDHSAIWGRFEFGAGGSGRP